MLIVQQPRPRRCQPWLSTREPSGGALAVLDRPAAAPCHAACAINDVQVCQCLATATEQHHIGCRPGSPPHVWDGKMLADSATDDIWAPLQNPRSSQLRVCTACKLSNTIVYSWQWRKWWQTHCHYMGIANLMLVGGAAFSALTDQQPGVCLMLLSRLPGSCCVSGGRSPCSAAADAPVRQRCC